MIVVVIGLPLLALGLTSLAMIELGRWIRGESRLVRWWCRTIAGHRYTEGVCGRCEETLW